MDIVVESKTVEIERAGPEPAVTAEPEPAMPKAPAPVEAAQEEVGLRVPFWLSAGLAVAAGGATTALWLSSLNDEKEFNNAIDHDDRDKALEAKERGENKKLASGITLGATAAATTAAVIFAITDLVRSKDEKTAQVFLSPGPGLGLILEF